MPNPARRSPLLLALLLLLTCLATLPASSGAEEEDPEAAYIRAHYTKYELRIPMRDGVRLFTSVYVPNDASQTYPFLMARTPYSVSPYGLDRYRTRLGRGLDWAKEGFIFVYQDVRGRYMSEGEFVNMRPHQARKSGPRDTDESTDTYDTIAWLLDHVQGHNGKVGLYGTSYPGFYASAGMIDSHPALAAVSPQAPIADWFIGDDMHHHGAFIMPVTFLFFSSFGQARPEPTTERVEGIDLGTPDGYQFFLEMGPLKNADERYLEGEIDFWTQLSQHPNYDEFWQSRNILPHLRNIGAAVMVVGGLFDTEDLYGPPATYQSVEEKNPNAFNMLVLGPWSHGAWSREGRALGEADFGFDTSVWYRENVEKPFFLHFLKDGPKPDLPEALIFETGANRWRRFEAWPPRATTTQFLYLREGPLPGKEALSALAPGAGMPDGHEDGAHDTYVSDPEKPVPFTAAITRGWNREYMTEDQRFAAWRPDVLVYESEPLDDDLTLAGPVAADLWVSTSGQDSDWIVKVIDVFPGEVPGYDEASGAPDPGGRQQLVRAEVFRGRFRESYERPAPFTPNEPTQVRFELRDLLHTFQRGHRLMVQIQSTWFPFVDRNPGSWVPNIFEAEEKDFITVTNRVFRSPEHPSRLEVGVLAGELPTALPTAAGDGPAAERHMGDEPADAEQGQR